MSCGPRGCSIPSRGLSPTVAMPSGQVEDCHCGGACDACAIAEAASPSGTMAIAAGTGGFAHRSMPAVARPKAQQKGGVNGGCHALPAKRGSVAGLPSVAHPPPASMPNFPQNVRGGSPGNVGRQSAPRRPPVVVYSSVGGSNPRGDSPGKVGGGGGSYTPPAKTNDNGGLSTPSRPYDAPLADAPKASAPAPAPITVLGLIPVGQNNPFSPYYGNGIDPASELCRAASAAGVSDYCREEMLRFLKSGSQMSLAEWIGAQELCDKDTLRAAAGIAASTIATKASQGLYNRSGGLPNYHRPSGDMASDYAAFLAAGDGTAAPLTVQENAGLDRIASGGQGGASDWAHGGPANLGFGGVGGETYAPPVPASPPVDYGALVAGIGTAVGASLAGIGGIVNQARQNRNRELEIEYANQARGAELALRRSEMELRAEIARLGSAGTPAATATVNALNSELSDLRTRLQAMTDESGKMGTGTMVALGLGGVAVLGAIAYFATRSGRRPNPSRKARR